MYELIRSDGRTGRHGAANRLFLRLARVYLINFMIGRVVAGAVSSWLLATDVQVRCKAGTYGIYGGLGRENLCLFFTYAGTVSE